MLPYDLSAYSNNGPPSAASAFHPKKLTVGLILMMENIVGFFFTVKKM
jgi:hypothetical protein